MDIPLEELTLNVLRRNDPAPGCPQQISPSRDVEQLVAQFGCQAPGCAAPDPPAPQGCPATPPLPASVAHPRVPRRRVRPAVHRSVPDETDVPARHRSGIVRQLRWGWRLAVALGVNRGKPDPTTGQQPHLYLAGTHPCSENLRHPHRRLLRRRPDVRCEMRRARRTVTGADDPTAGSPTPAASFAQVRTPRRRPPWRPPTAADWARPNGPGTGPRPPRPRRRPHRRTRPDRPIRADAPAGVRVRTTAIDRAATNRSSQQSARGL